MIIVLTRAQWTPLSPIWHLSPTKPGSQRQVVLSTVSQQRPLSHEVALHWAVRANENLRESVSSLVCARKATRWTYLCSKRRISHCYIFRHSTCLVYLLHSHRFPHKTLFCRCCWARFSPTSGCQPTCCYSQSRSRDLFGVFSWFQSSNTDSLSCLAGWTPHSRSRPGFGWPPCLCNCSGTTAWPPSNALCCWSSGTSSPKQSQPKSFLRNQQKQGA